MNDNDFLNVGRQSKQKKPDIVLQKDTGCDQETGVLTFNLGKYLYRHIGKCVAGVVLQYNNRALLHRDQVLVFQGRDYKFMYFHIEVNYNVTSNQKNREERETDANSEIMKIESLLQP